MVSREKDRFLRQLKVKGDVAGDCKGFDQMKFVLRENVTRSPCCASFTEKIGHSSFSDGQARVKWRSYLGRARLATTLLMLYSNS